VVAENYDDELVAITMGCSCARNR